MLSLFFLISLLFLLLLLFLLSMLLSLNFLSSTSATSWNQMQQPQKNLKYIAIMQKCIHKSFDAGFRLCAHFKTYINVQCHSCPSPLSSSPSLLFGKYKYCLYQITHICIIFIFTFWKILNHKYPGFPEPTVMWYHGTMKLVPTNNIVTVTTGRRNKLTFLRSVLF